jgi:hypothetical protein
MAESDKTADDFVAHWLTPRQAVAILDGAFKPGSGSVSKRTLLENLRGGMVQAVSANSRFQANRDWGDVFYKIPKEDWERVDTADDFWITGQLTYTRRDYGRSEQVTARHYNVRFEPYSVQAIVKATTERAAIEAVSAAAPESKGPPVSPAHLQAWFEFYKKIGDDMREDDAHIHARMCFLKNSVSRQKIRDLLPDRPMGRPRRDEA